MATQQALAQATSESLEGTHAARELAAAVDIYENQQQLLLLADMPGVTPEKLSVRLDPPELHIEGRLTDIGENAEEISFRRSFRINESVDPEGIVAELQHGVLRVTLKKSDAHRPRRIEVRAE